MDAAQTGSEALPVWDYSDQYKEILREGHHKQAPACGSPTLIWHIALWPRHPFGDHGEQGGIERRQSDYDDDNSKFFEEVSNFAEALQRRGRVGGACRGLDLTEPTLPKPPPSSAAKEAHVFKVCVPQALGFTLWWSDNTSKENRNKPPVKPVKSDMRVRVQVQTHRDHATISFFIDVSKIYNEHQVVDGAANMEEGASKRRRKIQEHVDFVRQVSGEQIRKGYVEMWRVPEQGVDKNAAANLLAAADYLYEGVWNDFADAFGITNLGDSENSPHMGRRFADFRGLVMSVRGLDSHAERKRVEKLDVIRQDNAPERDPKVVEFTGRAPNNEGQRDVPQYVTGTTGFGQLTKFDEKINEPNTVLKSLWPFMRRMTPWADYSDWVGCGIIGGRALYVTALGSEAVNVFENEEYDSREAEVPALNLPTAEDSKDENAKRPLRYLVVTKGEPPREQLGRYVERINAVGTMRLFALRNAASIRNASVHIEVLGRALDGTLQKWEKERGDIDGPYYKKRNELLAEFDRKNRNRKKDAKLRIDRRAYTQDLEDDHADQLDELIRETDHRVIEIAGQLDNIGEGGSGRMLYLIKRSMYFAEQFKLMYPTLAIIDVDGWINYRNFVNRGVQPALEFIEATGDRLRSIRERIQIVTDTIQTAALIVETAATKENTAALKRIATVRHAAWIAATGLILTGLGLFGMFALEVAGNVIGDVITGTISSKASP